MHPNFTTHWEKRPQKFSKKHISLPTPCDPGYRVLTWFPLVATMIFVTGTAWAQPVLAPLFGDTCQAAPAKTGPIVLQANFPADGEPVLRARLFGNSDSESAFDLTFSTNTEDILLDKVALKGTPQTRSVKPGGGPEHPWVWEGVFSCRETGGEVTLNLAGEPDISIQLGDVWILAGGDNIVRSGDFNPPPDQIFRVADGAGGLGGVIVRKKKHEEKPQTKIERVPWLAGHFASLLQQKTKRPLAVCLVSTRLGRAADWESRKPVWDVLFGDLKPRGKPLAARGIVWWIGEWDAELHVLPVPLPGDDPKVFWDGVRKWQKEEYDALLKVVTGFPAMIADESSHQPTSCFQASIFSLVVGLQGIDRQPAHLDLVPSDPLPSSTWELYRGAQVEVVNHIRALPPCVPGQPQATRAALVPAIPAQLQPTKNGDEKRWFWENAATFELLGKDLAEAAWRRLAPAGTPGLAVEIGPPTATWKADRSVELTFAGTVQGLPATLPPEEAQLQYALKSQPDRWLPAPFPWGNPLTIPAPAQAQDEVWAVRYGPGNHPNARHALKDAQGNAAGFIPVFRFHQPP